ncbi:hypothetical protein [Amycolatopsis umgeniensis]|uniref:Uncharacterized protein n=2 Tax=Amycolatopsis umgeniensis TaxID=336628 RepID=A0A841ATG2_9PSEU|nr:hypothetical protein [Amycolatopsis umgeniensis]
MFLVLATLAIVAADLVGFTRLTEAGGEPEIAGVERFDIRERGHHGTVAYDRVPPAGGPHDPALQNCGV